MKFPSTDSSNPAEQSQQPRRITVLPPSVVNRIAAGEVVERPASVVKELLENAIDAGATKIDIAVGDGGRSIRVADNGHGMDAENARLAFFNHATSKITDADDLFRLNTLGFRGEALASISSISRLVCKTRTADAPSGMKVTLNESGEPIISETGCSPGTVMEITDLFYNTPARLKFLKRPQTELGHVEELVQNLALAYPEVQFSLSLNGKPSFKTRPNSDLPAVLEAVSAGSIERTQLITIDDFDANEQTRLYGVISPPDSQKTSKRWVVTFINRRLVRCPIIAKAVEAAYESLMPQGRYPVAVLFVDMPGELVDVNVHPTKREVRYAHANAVFGFVRTALRRELEAKGFSTYTTPQAPEAFAAGLGLPPSSGGWSSGHSGTAYSSGGGYSSGFGGGSYGGGGFQRSITGEQSYAALDAYAPTQSPSGDAVEGNESTGLSFRVIGQLYRTYILLETPQGLMVVDQHIASERTFFESLTRSITSDLPQSQQWLTALPLDVSLEQYGLLSQQEAEFARLGFTYQLSNPDEPRRTVTLTAVPLVLAERDPVWQFETMLNQLQETGEMKPDMELWIATLACHSAVRAGDVLNHEQMTLVIRQWLGCTLPWTCPHGRPIAHTIKTEQLNQFFERTSLPVNAMSF